MKWNRIAASLILFFSLSVIAKDETAKNEAHSSDWKYLTSDGEKTTYILNGSPKYIGKDIVAAWYLWDYKLQQIGQADRKFMSMKQLSQFSCQSHTTQLLSVAMYVEKMAIGAPVAKANFKDQPWVNIAPQSAREVIFKYLCINK